VFVVRGAQHLAVHRGDLGRWLSGDDLGLGRSDSTRPVPKSSVT